MSVGSLHQPPTSKTQGTWRKRRQEAHKSPREGKAMKCWLIGLRMLLIQSDNEDMKLGEWLGS